MNKCLYLFLTFALALSASAQFNDLGVTVSPNGTLTNPSAAVFRTMNDIASRSDIPILKTLVLGTGLNGISYNGGAEVTASVNTSWLATNYHQTLTRGTGLLGSNYNGTAAATFAVDTSWLVTNYHKLLTLQNGVKFTSGANYNGTAARTMQMDKVYVLNWMNSLKRDFYFFIEMSPTPLDAAAFDTQTTSQDNVFYYRRFNSLNFVNTAADTSGATVSLSNATNILHSTTTDVPTSYDPASFTVSTPSASLGGSITYTRTTTANLSTIQTLNSSGVIMPTYNTNDKVNAMRYWTDCEMKVIDKWGNIVYYTSTIALTNPQVQNLHPAANITDSNPTIWFFGSYNYTVSGCYGIKTRFTNFNSSIGSTIGSTNTVSGIWIYPDLASTESRTVPVWTGYNQTTSNRTVVFGQYIREVMENPENSIIIWRQTTAEGELFKTKKLWRPVLPTYYGNLKEATN